MYKVLSNARTIDIAFSNYSTFVSSEYIHILAFIRESSCELQASVESHKSCTCKRVVAAITGHSDDLGDDPITCV